MNNITTKKKVMIVCSILFVAVALLLFLQSSERSDKTQVTIGVFPLDTTLILNGEKIEPGTTRLSPGTYEITAQKDGYDEYSRTISVDNEEQTIAVVLTPNTDATMKLSKEDEKELLKIQAIGEREAAEVGKTFHELNPIVGHLPHKTFIYTIGYRMDQSDPSGNSIIIEIDADEGYKQAALNYIRQLGFDPTDLNIIFRDYENPFPL